MTYSGGHDDDEKKRREGAVWRWLKVTVQRGAKVGHSGERKQKKWKEKNVVARKRGRIGENGEKIVKWVKEGRNDGIEGWWVRGRPDQHGLGSIVRRRLGQHGLSSIHLFHGKEEEFWQARDTWMKRRSCTLNLR